MSEATPIFENAPADLVVSPCINQPKQTPLPSETFKQLCAELKPFSSLPAPGSEEAPYAHIKPAPPVSERDIHTAARDSREATKRERTVTRRTTLFVGGMVLAGILLRVDHELMENNWADTDTTIKLMMPAAVNPPIYTGALLGAPGFGGIHGIKIPRNYKRTEALPPLFPKAAYSYSNTSMKKADIEANAVHFARTLDLQEIILHGESEGGIVSFVAAEAAGIPVRAIVLNCSPFDIEDAYDSLGAKIAARLGELGYEGGPVGKAATILLDSLREQGTKNFVTQVIEANHKLWRGADPRLMESQLVFLAQARLEKSARNLRRRGIITPDTTIFYIHPKDTGSDPTVRDIPADHKYEHLAELCGAHFVRIPIEQDGHAKTAAAITSVAPRLHLLQPARRRFVR